MVFEVALCRLMTAALWTNAFSGLGEVAENKIQRRRLSSQDAGGAGHDTDYDTPGEFVPAGAAGAKRKLMGMNWKVGAAVA